MRIRQARDRKILNDIRGGNIQLKIYKVSQEALHQERGSKETMIIFLLGYSSIIYVGMQVNQSTIDLYDRNNIISFPHNDSKTLCLVSLHN